jgi:peptidoglycan/LPS O-acetylase OafA/YrhL
MAQAARAHDKPGRESSHVAGLDILRFAAAMFVIAFHLGVATWTSAASRTFAAAGGYHPLPEIKALAWWGWVGVEIFFVISGYVIAYSAERSSPFGFFRSRTARLLPALWICATLTFLASSIAQFSSVDALLREYGGALLLLPFGPWIDGVYWTLCVEVVFYASVFALLCFKKFHHIDKLAIMLIGISGVYWVLSVVERLASTELAWLPDSGSQLAALMLLRHGCFFGAGIFLWLIQRNGLSARRAVVVLSALAIGCVEILFVVDSRKTSLGGSPLVPVGIWLIAMALLALAIWRRDAFRPHPVVRTLGLVTYPLYLTHNLVGAFLMRWFAQAGVERYSGLVLAVAIVLAVSYAVASFAEPGLKRTIVNTIDRAARFRSRGPVSSER